MRARALRRPRRRQQRCRVARQRQRGAGGGHAGKPERRDLTAGTYRGVAVSAMPKLLLYCGAACGFARADRDGLVGSNEKGVTAVLLLIMGVERRAFRRRRFRGRIASWRLSGCERPKVKTAPLGL